MDVNCFDISELTEESYTLLKKMVSKERRERAEQFRFTLDSYRCVCAEILLKYSLAEVFNREVEIDLVYNAYGKPMMRNLNRFYFNISHAGDWVVLAYGENEVGVDIEKIQLERKNIIEYVMSKEEKDYIYSAVGSECNKRFTEIWGLKESYVKYLGTGLSTPMNSFSVNMADNSILDESRVLERCIFLKSFLYEKKYYLSICSEEQNVTIKKITLKNLLKSN